MVKRNIIVTAGSFAFAFPMTILKSVKASAESGQSITHYYTRGRLEVEQKKYRALINAPGPIGVICVSTKPDKDTLYELLDAGISVVLVDETMEGVSSVSVDNYRGGGLAAEHLESVGRRRTAIVCGERHKNGGFNAVQRVNGFIAQMNKVGVQVPDEWIREVTDYSYDDGQRSIEYFIGRNSGIDAVFSAAGDDCATGILRGAQELNVRIPSDIAIVGFDDLASSKFATPALTTIRQPLEEIATLAYSMASDPSDKLIREPVQKVLEPTLIVRSST